MSSYREVIARMAVDAEFGAAVRRDPAAVAERFGLSIGERQRLAELADGGDAGAPQPLGKRLSKSGIGAGVLGALAESTDSVTAGLPNVSLDVIKPPLLPVETPPGEIVEVTPYRADPEPEPIPVRDKVPSVSDVVDAPPPMLAQPDAAPNQTPVELNPQPIPPSSDSDSDSDDDDDDGRSISSGGGGGGGAEFAPDGPGEIAVEENPMQFRFLPDPLGIGDAVVGGLKDVKDGLSDIGDGISDTADDLFGTDSGGKQAPPPPPSPAPEPAPLPKATQLPDSGLRIPDLPSLKAPADSDFWDKLSPWPSTTDPAPAPLPAPLPTPAPEQPPVDQAPTPDPAPIPDAGIPVLDSSGKVVIITPDGELTPVPEPAPIPDATTPPMPQESASPIPDAEAIPDSGIPVRDPSGNVVIMTPDGEETPVPDGEETPVPDTAPPAGSTSPDTESAPDVSTMPVDRGPGPVPLPHIGEREPLPQPAPGGHPPTAVGTQAPAPGSGPIVTPVPYPVPAPGGSATPSPVPTPYPVPFAAPQGEVPQAEVPQAADTLDTALSAEPVATADTDADAVSPWLVGGAAAAGGAVAGGIAGRMSRRRDRGADEQ